MERVGRTIFTAGRLKDLEDVIAGIANVHTFLSFVYTLDAEQPQSPLACVVHLEALATMLDGAEVSCWWKKHKLVAPHLPDTCANQTHNLLRQFVRVAQNPMNSPKALADDAIDASQLSAATGQCEDTIRNLEHAVQYSTLGVFNPPSDTFRTVGAASSALRADKTAYSADGQGGKHRLHSAFKLPPVEQEREKHQHYSYPPEAYGWVVNARSKLVRCPPDMNICWDFVFVCQVCPGNFGRWHVHFEHLSRAQLTTMEQFKRRDRNIRLLKSSKIRERFCADNYR